MSKDERCFLTTSAMSHPGKELSVFLYPLERMDRDAIVEQVEEASCRVFSTTEGYDVAVVAMEIESLIHL